MVTYTDEQVLLQGSAKSLTNMQMWGSLDVQGEGSGYISPPTITITGEGSGATATASLKVKEISLSNGGSGFTSNPTITFSGGGGSGATAEAVINNGQITAIKVTEGGSGYTSAPSLTITGGGGSGATAQAIMGIYGIITITNGGSGYAHDPVVTISAPPSGITAKAYAQTNGNNVVSIYLAGDLTVLKNSNYLTLKDTSKKMLSNLFTVTSKDNHDAPITAITEGVLIEKDLIVGGFLDSGQGALWLNYGLKGRPILSTPPCIQMMSSDTNYPSGTTLPPDPESGQLFNHNGIKKMWNGTDWVTGNFTGKYDTLFLFKYDGITPAHLEAGNLITAGSIYLQIDGRLQWGEVSSARLAMVNATRGFQGYIGLATQNGQSQLGIHLMSGLQVDHVDSATGEGIYLFDALRLYNGSAGVKLYDSTNQAPANYFLSTNASGYPVWVPSSATWNGGTVTNDVNLTAYVNSGSSNPTLKLKGAGYVELSYTVGNTERWRLGALAPNGGYNLVEGDYYWYSLTNYAMRMTLTQTGKLNVTGGVGIGFSGSFPSRLFVAQSGESWNDGFKIQRNTATTTASFAIGSDNKLYVGLASAADATPTGYTTLDTSGNLTASNNIWINGSWLNSSSTLYIGGASGAAVTMYMNGNVNPNGNFALGSGSQPWQGIVATNAYINSYYPIGSASAQYIMRGTYPTLDRIAYGLDGSDSWSFSAHQYALGWKWLGTLDGSTFSTAMVLTHAGNLDISGSFNTAGAITLGAANYIYFGGADTYLQRQSAGVIGVMNNGSLGTLNASNVFTDHLNSATGGGVTLLDHLYAYNAKTSSGGVYMDGTWGNLHFVGASGSNNWNVTDNNGNWVFQVWHSGYISAKALTSGALSANSNGTIYTSGSSQRYKTQIEDLQNTEWIYNLRPKTFYWNEDQKALRGTAQQIGLIAEEVEPICKQVVNYNNEGLAESLQYEKLAVPMISEMKKLRERIAKLEAETSEFRKQLAA